MLSAKDTFSESIKDAENLLAHFDELNSHPPPEELEVLKRAGLIMAMTAWETYVEDRVYELTTERLSKLADEAAVRFIQNKLEDELKRFHNPDSSKTIAFFRDFAGIDLYETWCFNNFDHAAATTRLDEYMSLRGDIVHRSRAALVEYPRRHPVKRDELEKSISFLKHLVDATEHAIAHQKVEMTEMTTEYGSISGENDMTRKPSPSRAHTAESEESLLDRPTKSFREQ